MKGFINEGIYLWRDSFLKGFFPEGINFWRDLFLKGLQNGLWTWSRYVRKDPFFMNPFEIVTISLKGIFFCCEDTFPKAFISEGTHFWRNSFLKWFISDGIHFWRFELWRDSLTKGFIWERFIYEGIHLWRD